MTRISIAGLLALALKSARSTQHLHSAMEAYDRESYVEAESLLLAQAHNGDAHAQELLGFLYAIGPDLYPGVWRNLIEARRWFAKAAEGGRPAAEHMHAAFLRRGPMQVRAEIMADFDAKLAAGGTGTPGDPLPPSH
jgi:TPR repeat protein